MNRISFLAVMVVTPLLMAALWMDRQPSHRPYEPPVLSQPQGSVPVSGREVMPREGELRNPVPPTAASQAEGKTLFDINCAMCHGRTSAQPGVVGQRIKPPPPGLGHDQMQERSDTAIFRAITFGFGRMPPFKDKLDSQERWKLVNYLRTRP